MPTPNDPPDPLDALLERARDTVPEPSDRLEAMVWRRLAAAEQPAAKASTFLAGIEAIFSRLSFTAAFVAACVLLGLFLAENRVSRLQAQRNVQFVQNYLHRIDPSLDGTGPGEGAVAPRP